MLYFRYKLKNIDLNKDFSQRSFASIVLYKNRWRYIDRELTELQPFLHLIDKEGPFTREEFVQKDNELKQKRIEELKEIGKERIKEKKLEKFTLDLNSLEDKSYDELYELAKSLKFTDIEIKYRDEFQLRELIKFELKNKIEPLRNS